MQAVVDIFLNDIHPFADWRDEVIGVDIHADTTDLTLVPQARQKGAISAAEIQHATTRRDPAKHGVQIQSRHDGPTRRIHSPNSCS